MSRETFNYSWCNHFLKVKNFTGREKRHKSLKPIKLGGPFFACKYTYNKLNFTKLYTLPFIEELLRVAKTINLEVVIAEEQPKVSCPRKRTTAAPTRAVTDFCVCTR